MQDITLRNKKIHICNVCLNSNYISLFKKKFKLSDDLKWFEKSILKILKKENIDYKINFCFNCFHIFISSSIDSKLLYSTEAANIRKNLFKSVNPNKIYGYNLAKKFNQKNENTRIVRLYYDIIKYSRNSKHKEINILDYGGDDGYIIDKLKKKLKKENKKYIYNIYDPQINTKIEKKGYDIVIISHVLEHISNLNDFFIHLKQYIYKNSLLIIEVPDERSILFKILTRKRIYLDYHLNYFTISSLKFFFKKHNIKLDLNYIYSSYRGNKIMSIYGIGFYKKNNIKIYKFKEILSIIYYLPRRLIFSFFT